MTRPFSQAALNNIEDDKAGNIERLVSQLRYWITAQRVHKTLQHLPATSYEQLPLLIRQVSLRDSKFPGCFCECASGDRGVGGPSEATPELNKSLIVCPTRRHRLRRYRGQ